LALISRVGIQLSLNQKITNFGAVKPYYDEIKAYPYTTWEDFKQHFKPKIKNFQNEFRKVAPIEKNKKKFSPSPDLTKEKTKKDLNQNENK
jgi:hypothetical protein